jgi:hypothetical protein
LVAALILGTVLFECRALAVAKGKEGATPVAKWEYKILRIENDPSKMEDLLNKLGNEGWECVGSVRADVRGDRIVTVSYLICKRPKK